MKKGDQRALAALGATGGEQVRVPRLSVTPGTVAVGGALLTDLDIVNTDDRAHYVTVDYVVHHVRGNGRGIPKVFKLTVLGLAPGERRSLRKAHSVREIRTRGYYPGEHAVDIQVNGLVKATGRFVLNT
ncbi:hypothetical protein [Streptomyces verrucosisporus]|uniref:hypothetical protein n=1 Tax=Streptomyces verrucosisporus TaxID=1695161 RepID=UPI001F127CA5|nr:hypothetical protein [Streptomyces verrucosisporus]